jgi:Membrane-bound toxin component of toxin-antitoxin system
VSLTPYGEPLQFEIRPSLIIAVLLFTIHLTAAAICMQLPLALMSRLIIFIAILGSLMWNIVIFWRRTPGRLRWSLEDGWSITNYRGIIESVELLPKAHLGSWFVIAYFRTASGKQRIVMLARDSCSSEGLRRLRVLLRYGTPKR